MKKALSIILSLQLVGSTVIAADDCCLCNDCNFEALEGTIVGVDRGESTVLTDCAELAADLFFYADADECSQQIYIYQGVCCPAVIVEPTAEEENRSRSLQFISSWSFSSSGGWPSTTTTSQRTTTTFGFSPSFPSQFWPSRPALPRPSPPAPAPRNWWNPAPSPSGSTAWWIPSTPNLPLPSPISWFPAPRPAPVPRPVPQPRPAPQPAPPANWGNSLPSTPSSSSSQQWVNAHNTRRQQYHQQNRVSYVPVKWSNDLAGSARTYTQRLLSGHSNCQIRHGFQNDRYGGENLAMQITGSSTAISPDAVLRMWYEGEIGLPYPQNGHLTQVAWRGTKHVGCASLSKPLGNGRYCHIQTCRYIAPGNCGGVENILQTTSGCSPQCPREGCF